MGLDRFILAWLLLEVAGYFALSPFPAARRLGGPLLVMTLAAGRLAHRTGVARRMAAGIAAAGAAQALIVFAADAADARAARGAARLAARSGHALAEGGSYWHFCWWGVGYYAEQAGLRQLQVNREVPRAGDLLAVHDVPEVQQFLRIQPLFRAELLETIETGDVFPLRACPGTTTAAHHSNLRAARGRGCSSTASSAGRDSAWGRLQASHATDGRMDGWMDGWMEAGPTAARIAGIARPRYSPGRGAS